MVKKVRCRLCGKEFKQITRDHLKYKHNVDYKDYKKMYPNDNLMPNKTRKIYVKHANRPKVKCELCGKEYYRLADIHMKTKHNTSLKEYLIQYPNTITIITLPEERELIAKNHADINGNKNPFYGKKHDLETRKRISERVEELWQDDEYRNDVLEHRYCNENYDSNKYQYSFEFRYMRDIAFQFWGRVCNICGSTEHLCIHHIDYNKENNYLKNLIPLCNSCHSKTNYHRETWQRLFECNCIPHTQKYWEYFDTEEEIDEEELLC